MSGHTSGAIIVYLSYLPPELYETTEGVTDTYDEEWTVLRIEPECPVRRCHGRERLCDACWFLEHINSTSLEYFTEPLEWEGRGKEAATVKVTGRLDGEETNTTEGWDYDESFEIDSMEILPPEPDRAVEGW